MKGYYVYQHRRIDTNEVFYVGMSTISKAGHIYQRAYRAAFATISRNGLWEQYAKNVQYLVEILGTFNDEKSALDFEIVTIKTYGRLDLGTGSLINQCDGGRGIVNPGPAVISKMMTNRKLVHNSERVKRSQVPYSTITYKYSKEGIFIAMYPSIAEAARSNNTLTSDILQAINGKRYLIVGFQWRNYKSDNIGKPPEKRKSVKAILQIDSKTGIILKEWDSVTNAAKSLNIIRTGINNCLTSKNNTRTSGGYAWKYKN